MLFFTDLNAMNLNHQLAELQRGYQAAFNTEFDPHAFRGDAFYASQVLDRALRNGRAGLRALAFPLEQLLLDALYSGDGTQPFDGRTWAALFHESRRNSFTPCSTSENTQGQTQRQTKKAAPPKPQTASLPDPVARFADRDIFFIARLRLQYRRRFGTFFDIFEFTRNDHYARSLLMICAGSGDAALQSLAGRFSGRGGR